jgi:hypothetical protein
MPIQTSFALDGETDPQPLAEVIQLPGVELVDEQLDPIEDYPPYRGPLDADSAGIYPTALRGGVVTDPVEIAAIRARVEAGAEQPHRAIRRLFRRIRGGA